MTLTPEEINIVLAALREAAIGHQQLAQTMMPGTLERGQHEAYASACGTISDRIEAASKTPARPSLIIPAGRA